MKLAAAGRRRMRYAREDAIDRSDACTAAGVAQRAMTTSNAVDA